MTYQLSILDKCPLDKSEDAASALSRSLQLVQLAERLGYHRYWFAEHHNSAALASPSPELLIARAIGETKSIRLGSGGVMLQHYSPYKVAENFNLLSALAPDRIDLGVGKAPGGLPLATRALQQGVNPAEKGDFAAQIRLLDGWLQPARQEKQEELKATPAPAQPASRFLLGASRESARLAAELAWDFVYAAHINGDEQLMQDALLAYTEHSGGKKALVALQVIAATTQAEAAALAEGLCVYHVMAEGQPGVNVSTYELAELYVRQAGYQHYTIEKRMPSLLHGTAGDIHQKLTRLHEKYHIDEFIIDTPVAEARARVRSIELLANRTLT